jgi:hypothetical protein
MPPSLINQLDSLARARATKGGFFMCHAHTTSITTAGLLLGMVVLGPAGGGAWAQCHPDETAKITATDAAANDRFGYAVAIDGDLVLIGSLRDDGASSDPAFDCGAVYVCRHDGTAWVEEQKLLAFDAEERDHFGMSCAVDGVVAVVGAADDDEACPADPGCNSGAAYVYRHDGSAWQFEQKLKAFDAAREDRFGHSVSVSGEVIVVGAGWDDDARGSAYVYRYDGAIWEFEQKLTATGGEANEVFGRSVSVSRDHAVVGSRLRTRRRPPGSATRSRSTANAWWPARSGAWRRPTCSTSRPVAGRT